MQLENTKILDFWTVETLVQTGSLLVRDWQYDDETSSRYGNPLVSRVEQSRGEH